LMDEIPFFPGGRGEVELRKEITELDFSSFTKNPGKTPLRGERGGKGEKSHSFSPQKTNPTGIGCSKRYKEKFPRKKGKRGRAFFSSEKKEYCLGQGED